MPRVIDHELYKEEILEKCFDLFARRGYDSLTMRELAREPGLSTGSLFHYFPAFVFNALVGMIIGRFLDPAGDRAGQNRYLARALLALESAS